MNRITEDFKKNLAARYSQKEETPIQPVSSQSRTIPNSEQRFMQLFQSINRPPQQQTVSPSPVITQPNEERFASTLVEYSNAPSFIDSVVAVVEDALAVGQGAVGVGAVGLVEPPLLLSQKVPFEAAIREIGLAFEGTDYVSHSDMVGEQLLDLQAYSTVLAALGRRNKAAEAKVQAKGKAIIREPTLAAVRSLRQIETDTRELQQQVRVQAQRMKKIDLILVELITEKKRKNYMVDYEASMEMKLLELLDFILQDEAEYAGLDPATKTRLVLRNLESFQGKTIEGESKINLLRIFFEEFTALKKQKEEEYATPMKKLDNRERPTKTRPQSKKTTAKGEVFTQENSHAHSHTHSHTEKRSAKRANTQAGEKRDEWMGSLS